MIYRVRFGTQEYGRYRTALHCRHRLAMVCIERKQTLEAEEQVL